MSPRTGRPKAEKPLTIEVKARIDVETNDKLVKYCKDNGITRTEVVRKGIEKVLNEKK
ncbi:MAG: RepB family protein [Acutalibacteraceae bacterium]|nr:RepB family protein [Acutalibacteraceae bacterium]